jgi:hypothetical protein
LTPTQTLQKVQQVKQIWLWISKKVIMVIKQDVWKIHFIDGIMENECRLLFESDKIMEVSRISCVLFIWNMNLSFSGNVQMLCWWNPWSGQISVLTYIKAKFKSIYVLQLKGKKIQT